MSSLYWKIRYFIRNRYVNMRYKGKPPKIYYDKWLGQCISPTNLWETGEMEYLAGELARSGLIYHYYLDGKLTHAHLFSKVLCAAYNNAKSFEILLDYREYSEQEIELISKLNAKGREDIEAYEVRKTK